METENNSTKNNEEKGLTENKNACVVLKKSDLDPQQHKRIQAMLGNGKEQATSYVIDKCGEKLLIDENCIKTIDTLCFQNCKECEIIIDEMCTKIFFDSCSGCKVSVNKRVVTAMVEVWKSQNMNLMLNVKIGTLVMDVCKVMKVCFNTLDNVGSLVWTTVFDLNVTVLDAPEQVLNSGVEQMKLQYEDLREATDQFIIRVVKGQLLSEKMIRLPNGFPTTEREKKEFDDRQEANMRILAQNAGLTVGKKKTGPRIKPNEPCHCGSGKKYKKCLYGQG